MDQVYSFNTGAHMGPRPWSLHGAYALWLGPTLHINGLFNKDKCSYPKRFAWDGSHYNRIALASYAFNTHQSWQYLICMFDAVEYWGNDMLTPDLTVTLRAAAARDVLSFKHQWNMDLSSSSCLRAGLVTWRHSCSNHETCDHTHTQQASLTLSSYSYVVCLISTS